MKKLLKQAANRFNTDKKGWLKFAMDSNLVEIEPKSGSKEEANSTEIANDSTNKGSEANNANSEPKPTADSVARFLLVTLD